MQFTLHCRNPPYFYTDMLTTEQKQKIASCKALQGMSIMDVVNTERFIVNLEKYMKAQRDDRAAIRSSYDAMRKLGGAKGMKIPAHVCDRVLMLPANVFAMEYLKVIAYSSEKSASEREYIRQLGQQAYNLTTAQYVCDEFPELHDVFFPKTNQN